MTTTSISIGWEPPVSDGSNDVMQYDIDMREESDVDYLSVAKVSNRITSYTVEELHRGRLYRFRVRSKNAAGYSESAAELDAPVQLKALGMHAIICVMMTLFFINTNVCTFSFSSSFLLSSFVVHDIIQYASESLQLTNTNENSEAAEMADRGVATAENE